MAPVSRNFPRSSSAALTAVALAALTACGGGGGGDTPPPVVVKDTTPPTVLMVTPPDGATNVQTLTELAFTMSEPIPCVSGDTKISMRLNGVVQPDMPAKLACDPVDKTKFRVTHQSAPFPAGKLDFSVTGFSDEAGNSMVPFAWGFTVASSTSGGGTTTPTWVYSLNNRGGLENKGISRISVGTGAVTNVTLPIPEGTGYLVLDGSLAETRGVVYAAFNASTMLHRVNAQTGQALAGVNFVQSGLLQGARGIAASDDLVCVVFGMLGVDGYALTGGFSCWDVTTATPARVFEGPAGFVGAGLPTMVYYSKTMDRFYVLTSGAGTMGSGEAVGAGARDAFLPGTGSVVEIACRPLPCRTMRSFAIDGAPQGVVEVGGKLIVTAAGNRTLHTISLDASSAISTHATGMTDLEHPMRLAYVGGKLFVTDYKSALRVLDPATLREVGRVDLPGMPIGMTQVGGELWVALPAKFSFKPDGSAATYDLGDSIAVVDPTTLTVKRVISGVGQLPWALLAF